jgi:hypothetical protein
MPYSGSIYPLETDNSFSTRQTEFAQYIRLYDLTAHVTLTLALINLPQSISS